ncbi:Hypothetical protein A7982_00568 [Minicystis rosea]|nr:Hypothetical protein A7982_00568 [Minicystis rosea]
MNAQASSKSVRPNLAAQPARALALVRAGPTICTEASPSCVIRGVNITPSGRRYP